MQVVFLLIGLAVGALAVWSVTRSQLARLSAEVDQERRAAESRAALKDEVETTLKAHSAELDKGAREELAQRQRAVEQMIAPLMSSLEKMDGGVRELERVRGEAYGALREQLGTLAVTQERLRLETANLVTALRAPTVRGRWGEIQLRRVVEMAGMLPHCDFVEQESASADGRTLRPDLVVKLPGGKNIVVDSKAPLQAYLDALEAADEETRRARLRDHARQMRDHVGKLSAKAYWQQFEPTPEFVVLFIPGDPFFGAALDHDPALIEDAVAKRVIIATPTTLIALLRAVAYGWRQETVAESARAVSELGKELYDRIGTLAGHFASVGKSLDAAVRHYNDAAGSLERRVLVSARRFADLGAARASDLTAPEPVERAARALQAPELVARVPGLQPPAPAAQSELPHEDAEDVPDAA